MGSPLNLGSPGPGGATVEGTGEAAGQGWRCPELGAPRDQLLGAPAGGHLISFQPELCGVRGTPEAPRVGAPPQRPALEQQSPVGVNGLSPGAHYLSCGGELRSWGMHRAPPLPGPGPWPVTLTQKAGHGLHSQAQLSACPAQRATSGWGGPWWGEGLPSTHPAPTAEGPGN